MGEERRRRRWKKSVRKNKMKGQGARGEEEE
jgi:hypothetical protein